MCHMYAIIDHILVSPYNNSYNIKDGTYMIISCCIFSKEAFQKSLICSIVYTTMRDNSIRDYYHLSMSNQPHNNDV